MRPSGRAPDEMRVIDIQTGFTKHAEGSVLIGFGDTRVLVTASVEECTVLGDRDLLFQAVTNLIDNAIKFGPEGGEVRVDVAVAGASATVRVRDTGPGVPEVHRGRLTERFFRAPGSERNAGTGLGLSLAKAIAEAHGGDLAFAGNAGEFEVRLSLPLAGPKKNQRPA